MSSAQMHHFKLRQGISFDEPPRACGAVGCRLVSVAGWPNFHGLLNKLLYLPGLKISFRHYGFSCQVRTGFITSAGMLSVA